MRRKKIDCEKFHVCCHTQFYMAYIQRRRYLYTCARTANVYVFVCDWECLTVCIREVVSMSNIDFRPRTANVCTESHFNYMLKAHLCCRFLSTRISTVISDNTKSNDYHSIAMFDGARKNPDTGFTTAYRRHRPRDDKQCVTGSNGNFVLFCMLKHYRVSVMMWIYLFASAAPSFPRITDGVCASGCNGAMCASTKSQVTWHITFVLFINSVRCMDSSECCSQITQMHYEYSNDAPSLAHSMFHIQFSNRYILRYVISYPYVL